MGEDLCAHHEGAKNLYEAADKVLGSHFSQISFKGPEEELTQTKHCQPALFVHGLALFEILQSEIPELRFQFAAGLSLGEFTAHAAAGTFDFATGLEIVAARGAYMQEACENTSGGMLALLGVDEEVAQRIAHDAGVDVANFNSPGQIVLSGDKNLLPHAAEISKKHGAKKAIPLKVAGAYHSRLMASAQKKIEEKLAAITIQEPSMIVYSNVTGHAVNQTDHIKQTLVQQVTGSVRWEQCIQNMVSSGVEELIELGPGKIISGLCKKIAPDIHVLNAGTYEELKGISNELK